jgi:signal transduction histidine kinase/DNA-binding response OmpR family regulator
VIRWLPRLVARLPLPVHGKLLFAFLAIVGLLIAVGAVGLQVLSGVNRRAEDMVKLQRKIAAYRQLQHDTTSQLYGVSSALLVPDDRTLEATLRQLNQFGYDLDRLAFVAQDEVELFGRVREDYEEFIKIVTQVIELIRAGQGPAGRELQLSRAGPLADRLERLTNELVNKAEADMVASIETSQDAYVTSQRVVVGFAVGSILLALLLGYGISWSVIGPVQQMDVRLREIAGGDFAKRVEVSNRDELGTLAANLNRMSDELGRLYRQLEAASRHKSEFLASMSHELRTPLNAIIGFSRLVMRRSRDVLPIRQYENLEKILISAEHLLALINDVLDLSKIEAGRVEIRPVAFDIEPLVDLCLRTVEPLVKSERVHLVKAIETDLPRLHTDEDKVKQILINLLSNAIKFTDEGTITVTVARRGHDVTLAVADSGIGIPTDKLDLIFEEFRQVDSTNTRKHGGTGLGLAISRRFARLLGGDLTVVSTPEMGSVFTLRIPPRYEVGPVIARAGAPAPDDPHLRPEGGGRLVLAIDDDPDAIYLLQENLAEAGYRVVGALSGEEGLRKAKDFLPFAITLDITMPQRNGWEVLHDLKTDPATRDIPVIVVSIVDSKELGYRLGAADYLLKPFNREAIVGTLTRLPSRQGRLLVVDDDPRVVDLVRQFLEGEPYEVVSAVDGEQALVTIAHRPPDIILLDLLMPGVGGFAVIEHLQQSAHGRAIPVIVLTAKQLEPAERAWLEQSVVKIVQKLGLDRDTFLRDLQHALSTCSRRAELKM